MSNALVPYSDIEKMAAAVAKSNLFGLKTTEQAIALMLVAQAQGIHPAQAATDYSIIQGKPSLTANAMLSRFQQSGGRVEYHTYTDTECCATFTHPQGGSLKLSWTFEQARRAGLTGKDNWKMYSRAMLRARVIAEGIRAVYPAVLGGMYAVEEVQDFDAKPPRNVPASKQVEKVIEGEVLPPETAQESAPADPEIAQLASEQHVDLVANLLFQIDACETMDCLKEHYAHAMSVLKDDKAGMKQVYDLKNSVKARIDAKIAEDASDAEEL